MEEKEEEEEEEGTKIKKKKKENHQKYNLDIPINMVGKNRNYVFICSSFFMYFIF